MSHRTQLSRADLLACLQVYNTDQLDAFAEALGYTRREPPPPPHAQAARPSPVTFTMPEAEQPTPPIATPKARFHRVVAQRHLDPAEVQRHEPDWYPNDEEVLHAHDPALRANPEALPPPPAPPLMPWSRLWPFLKAALGAQQSTSALDIPPIVERLARRQPLTDVPRKQRPGWATACQVIVDYAMPLFPFWSDFETLCRRLQPLRSTQGLAVFALPDGHPEGRCWSHTTQGWQASERYHIPTAGTPVLVLSDLGCLDTSDTRRRQWRRLGQRLRRAGCRPIALMPCPARWWDVALIRLFFPVCWDRAVRPPQRLTIPQVVPGASARTVSAHDAGAELLLTLLAPAVRVEPALLRAVRYLLPAHDADVGSEAAAWNHPQVQANALALSYRREALIAYREHFKRHKDAPLRRQVAALIAAHHAHLSPVITEEEARITADLLGEPYPEKGLWPRLVKTLRTQQGDLVHTMYAWVQRMVPRQHAAMWRDEVLQALVVAGQIRQKEALALPPGIALHQVSWLLAPQAEPQHYTLLQRGRALYLASESLDQSAVAFDAPGSPLAAVRAAASIVQWQHSDAQHTAEAVPGHPIDQAIPLPASGLLHLSTDYQELTIDSIERPAWADAIGRDAYGLFVECSVAGVTQRLRWIAPGEFLMGSPDDEPERSDDETQHLVRLSRGFWLADTPCTQALWQAVMRRNPSRFKGADRPVDNVSWNQVQNFLEWLNAAVSGGGFRLPTEAEWEYACRAGTATAFWFGNQITPEQVNYDGNHPYAGGRKGIYREETVPVQALPCNSWGLYQMHGNVWEWCQDWYAEYGSGPVTDPGGPPEGGFRVLRGGGWIRGGRGVRSASRAHEDPGFRFVYFGFRLARG